MRSVLLLGLAGSALALPSPDSQAPWPRPVHSRADAVRRAFRISWEGYARHALPHDTLHPGSNDYEDDRDGWGVTLVDALTTAAVMGEFSIMNQILDHIANIDFSTTKRPNDPISVFETTIRFLGGLISGYDLLTGPINNTGVAQSKIDKLLEQAERLADSISIAFNTSSGVPDPTVFLNPTRRRSDASDNNIAEIGTLVLEWTRLSDLSGNPRYGELAQKAESYLLRPRGSPEAWPGLVGTMVSLDDGKFQDSNGGWSGGTDSFYEYLIKMYQYDPAVFGEYKERWTLAADSTMVHLASHPTTRRDLTYLSQYWGQQTIPVSSHLASFAGANFILGGAVLGSKKYLEFGLNLTQSYYNNYLQTPTGIGPEVFRWVDAALPAGEGGNEAPPSEQRDFYERAGFYATSAAYILRPETSESLYYAYRATADPKWQDMAWRAFGRIAANCRAGSGYAGLNNVMQPGSGIIDQMQSFWMAETLKYLYLIFAPDSDVQLHLLPGSKSRFVFNTEAHPIHVRDG